MEKYIGKMKENGRKLMKLRKNEHGNATCYSRDNLASMVNASRLQSTDEPSFRICFVIFPPYSSFHFQTC